MKNLSARCGSIEIHLCSHYTTALKISRRVAHISELVREALDTVNEVDVLGLGVDGRVDPEEEEEYNNNNMDEVEVFELDFFKG